MNFKIGLKALVAFGLALSAFIGIDATEGDAEAKQCIWNKAGFILRARWYNRSDLVQYEKDGKIAYAIKQGATHVQLDEWPIAEGRCTRGANASKELAVVLSIVGGKIAVEAAKIGAVTGAAIVVGVAGAVACVGTAGAGCGPAAAGGIAALTALAGGAANFSVQAIPDAKETFLITVPSTRHYLDVWGTVWSPQTGQGGPI